MADLPERRSLVAKREAYRRVILDSAEELFAVDGVDGTRIEVIANAAGVAPRTLYTVFASKAEIVEGVRERRRVALIEQAQASAATARSAFEALVLTVRAASRFFLAHPDYLRLELLESRAWSDEGPSQSWHVAFRAYTQAFTDAMAAGDVRDGDPTAFARALLAIQQSQLAHWVSLGMPADHGAVDDVEAMLVRAFATGAGAARLTMPDAGAGPADNAPASRQRPARARRPRSTSGR